MAEHSAGAQQQQETNVLGGFLALLSAGMFAAESAAVRRGVLTASVAQALAVGIPVGIVIFFVATALSGSFGVISAFPANALFWLASAGILHFVWGRYCNYRAAKAMGANLVAPVLQSSILVTLALAMGVLGEYLTPLRLLGIAFVILGPALAIEPRQKKPEAAGSIATEGKGGAVFRPNYAEGYLFGLLCSLGYGASPILVRLALEDKGLSFSLAAGLISYAAAGTVFALILLWPGQYRHVRTLDAASARWFLMSAVCSSLAQMMRYLALAVAPATVVVPILRLSLVFRFFFSRLINPQHEVFGGRMFFATAASLVGVLALSISVEFVQSLLPLPEWAIAMLNWRWPPQQWSAS
jgi:drug/metabolite transporter (DMT)-like permease